MKMENRKSKGRQKIEIEKMQKESNLQVTFSKRRSGLMKKANELCTLTGAEIAVITFSPGNKPYTFGNPSIQSIIRRYQSESPKPQDTDPIQRLLHLHRQAKLEELHGDYALLQKQLEAEKNHGATMNQMEQSNQNKNWWEAPTESLTSDQLEKLKRAMEDLRKSVCIEFENLKNQEIQKDTSLQLQKASVSYDHSENPCGYMPAFADSRVYGKNLGPSPDGKRSFESGGGFAFTQGASSSSNDGLDLNLPEADAFACFAVPDSYNHGYGPRF